MSGFLSVSTTIHGVAGSPGIPFVDSPTGGFFETPGGGVGVALTAQQFLLLEKTNFSLGFKPTPTFNMSTIAGSPFTIGSSSQGQIGITPDGTNVYVPNTNSIQAYIRNVSTGALTPVVGSPFANTGARGLVSSPDGAFIYCLSISTNNVMVYSRNALTGVITAIGGSPYTTGANTPYDLCMSADGKHLYICTSTSNNIVAFTRNLSTGALSAVAGSPFTTGANAYSIVISPDDKHVYVSNNTDSTITAFSRDSTTGTLTIVTGSPFATGTSPRGLVMSPDGRHVYALNNGVGNVTAYSRNSNSGVLTVIPGSPFTTDTSQNYGCMSPDGTRLFIAHGSARNRITTYVRDPNTGALTASQFFADGVVHYNINRSNDGNHIFTTSSSTAVMVVIQLADTTAYNLIAATFDQTGGLGGSININGLLYVQGSVLLNQGLADLRYLQLLGTITNDNAATGVIGEFITAAAAPGAVSLTTATSVTVTSISLTAGDWEVSGVVNYTPAAATSITRLAQGASVTNNTLGAQDTYTELAIAAEVPTAIVSVNSIATQRFSLAATTTVYLITRATFTLGTLTAGGTIQARRMR